MSNERIDVTELEKRFEDGLNWDDSDTMDLITELKRCYNVIDGLTWRHAQVLKEREDLHNIVSLQIDALQIIRDDLDEAIAQGHLPIKSADGIDATKIRNFANDATQ